VRALHLRLAFSDPSLLHCLEGNRLTFEEFTRGLFLAERRLDYRIPDHSYRLALEHNLRHVDSFSSLLTEALPKLAMSFLSDLGDRLHVKEESFEEWQQLITRMSPLFLFVCAMFHKYRTDKWSQEDIRDRGWEKLRPQLARSALLTVQQAAVEELIANEGLADLHVHLNGSTEMDHVWLHALLHVDTYLQKLSEAHELAPVTELYEQIEPGLSPTKVADRLYAAGRLRSGMCAQLLGSHPPPSGLGLIELANRNTDPALTGYDGRRKWDEHPMRKHFDHEPFVSETECEAQFLLLALSHLVCNTDEVFAEALHAYLLIQGSTFIPLCVQQCEQVGFDQFHKLTMNNARDCIEQEYCQRFHQAAYVEGLSDLWLLEGRFAPKATRRQTADLLNRIYLGFRQYCDESSRVPKLSPGAVPAGRRRARTFKLRLVAHFIKRREPDAKAIPKRCRFQEIRQTLDIEARKLVGLRSSHPHLAKLVRGIDAAGNELHTPPEVFAPVFRYVRHNGIRRATFHVGEDFHHLLSGIRAVWEAVDFLDLAKGDRIGHGIAVGIDPKRWLGAMPGSLVLPAGEWLDSLVFAFFVLARIDASSRMLARIKKEVRALATRVYALDHPGRLMHDQLMDDLIAAWQLRDHDPLRFLDPELDERPCIEKIAAKEREAILVARAEQPCASDLYERYHCADVVQRSMELVEVECDFIPATTLRAIQDHTLRLLVRRRIAIETLPTSNVRISYYESYKDHHISRWLASGREQVRPPVCVGSDDPGIFATNMRNEFLHIYFSLRHAGRSERDALDALRELNQNARRYAFQ